MSSGKNGYKYSVLNKTPKVKVIKPKVEKSQNDVSGGPDKSKLSQFKRVMVKAKKKCIRVKRLHRNKVWSNFFGLVLTKIE